jgi:hypothetical protein
VLDFSVVIASVVLLSSTLRGGGGGNSGSNVSFVDVVGLIFLILVPVDTIMFFGSRMASLISLQTPMRMPPPPPRTKSIVSDEFVQKPVMLPLPPPFNTQTSKVFKLTEDRPIRVQLPPPPPIRRGYAQTSESKNTLVPAGPKQQLPAMPPPPPLPPTKKHENLQGYSSNTIQKSPNTIQSERQKSKSERINVGKKSFTAEGNDLKTDSHSKSISKYLSYFDPESLYHQSPWSIKASNIQLYNPKEVVTVAQPTKKPVVKLIASVLSKVFTS